MSYFDDQEDCWLANDCKGEISDYDPYDGDNCPQEKKTYTPPANKVQSSAGRTRHLLAISKIDEFAAWAQEEGFKREPTKGIYEVLRLRFPKFQPYIFFQRAGSGHATCQSEGTQLVQRWLRDNKPREAVK
jgi:hypothetical protein